MREKVLWSRREFYICDFVGEKSQFMGLNGLVFAAHSRRTLEVEGRREDRDDKYGDGSTNLHEISW